MTSYKSDFDIANGTGAQVRSNFNTALKALATHSADGTKPAESESYAYQLWADTGTGKLKIRDASAKDGNNEFVWHEIGSLNTANMGLAKLASPTFSGSSTFTGEVVFSTNSSIQLPKGTTQQRPTGVDGDIRYNTDTNQVEAKKAGSWENVGSGQGGATGGNGGANACFWENQLTITHDYTIGSNKGAGTFGDVTISADKTVTIPSGSSWTVV